MAPTAGKQAGNRGKHKGKEATMEKYVTGGKEAWRRSLEKIVTEIEK